MIRIPATFDVYRAGRPNVRYEGWFPYELLEVELRQRLEALTVGPVPNRDAQIAGFKAKILDMLESRRDESGQIVLHFESDTRVYLDPTKDWEFSSMSTQVQRDDGQLTGVDLDTFLNTPLRGLQKRPHPPRRLRGLRGADLRSPPALDGTGVRV